MLWRIGIYFIYLQNTHYEKVYIGKLRELVNEILGEEGNHCVLAGCNLIVVEQLSVCLDRVNIKLPQRRCIHIISILMLVIYCGGLITRGFRSCIWASLASSSRVVWRLGNIYDRGLGRDN